MMQRRNDEADESSDDEETDTKKRSPPVTRSGKATRRRSRTGLQTGDSNAPPSTGRQKRAASRGRGASRSSVRTSRRFPFAGDEDGLASDGDKAGDQGGEDEEEEEEDEEEEVGGANLDRAADRLRSVAKQGVRAILGGGEEEEDEEEGD